MAGIYDSLVGNITNSLSDAQGTITNLVNSGASNQQIADATTQASVIQNKLSIAQLAQAQDNSPLMITTPESGPLGTSSGSVVTGLVSNTDPVDFRVRLRAFPNTWNNIYGDPVPENIMFPLHPEAKSDGFIGMNGMVFPYTPTISQSQSVNYTSLNVVHSNQDYLAYSHTPSASYTITGQFTAQNAQEARYMLACMHFLRTVTKMRYGASKNAGLPPPTLLLSGYGKYYFNDLPVVVTQFSFDSANDVDLVEVYVAGNGGVPVAYVPAIMSISVSVTVQQTPNIMRQFDWDAFASGRLMDDKRGGWV